MNCVTAQNFCTNVALVGGNPVCAYAQGFKNVSCTGADSDVVIVTQGELKAQQMTVKDAFGTATSDQYVAMGAIFGLLLCAACLIWGTQQILDILRRPPEC
jgi:hypothetical protein